MRLSVTKRSASLTALLLAAAAVIAYCLALTNSPSMRFSAAYDQFDVRVKGLRPNSRISTDFSFAEARVAALTSVMRVVFEEAKAGSAPEKRIVYVPGKIVTASDLPAVTKLIGITVEPRFGVLLPSVSFGALPLLLFVALLILAAAATYSAEMRTLSPIPPLIILATGYLLLSRNRLDNWDRAWWLLLSIAMLCIGAILFHLLIKRDAGTTSTLAGASAQRSSGVLAIAAIVGMAAVVRFQGIGFGLPGFFHPDEGRKVKIARNMVVTGDLNPHYFRHPTFLLYATAAASWIDSKIQGRIPDLDRVALCGRTVSAILGTASVLLIYLITTLFYGRWAGYGAAALLAVAPLHVVSSRYIKEDAALVFFTLVCFYFVTRCLVRGPFARNLLLASFFAGVSASSKYSGMLNVMFVVAVFSNSAALYLSKFLPPRLHSLRALFLDRPWLHQAPIKLIGLATVCAMLAGLGFVLVSPYSILDQPQFIRDFIGEKVHMERGHTVPITALSYFWTYHLHYSVLPAMGAVTALLAFVACGFLLARARFEDLLILSAALLYYLPSEYVNAKPQPQPERYILPCVPFLAIALGALLSRSAEYLSQKSLQLGRLAYAALLAAAALPPLSYSWSHAQSIKDDTRNQARRWLIDNVPRHSKLLIDWKFYSAPLLHKHFDVLEMKDKKGVKHLRTISKESLSRSDFDYLVISSFFYGRFLDPLYRAHNLSKRFKALFKDMHPAAVFSNPQYAYGFHNPDIYIFKIPKGAPRT